MMLETKRCLVVCLRGKEWHYSPPATLPTLIPIGNVLFGCCIPGEKDDTGCLCAEAPLLQKLQCRHKILGDTGGNRRDGKLGACFIAVEHKCSLEPLCGVPEPFIALEECE